MCSVVQVSVPTKGTHLLYKNRIIVNVEDIRVSVPTKGTHLLYWVLWYLRGWKRLRFPSPRRGPIFSTILMTNIIALTSWFPSPRRGPIFSTKMTEAIVNAGYKFPSPRRGPIFSTPSGLYTNFRIITAHFSW